MPEPFGDPNEGIGLAARVILHLAELPRLDLNDVAPVDRTQQGMVQALSVRQGSLGKVLHRLCVADVLAVERRFVGGVNRRMKVYRLTPLGDSAARNLWARRPPSAPAGPSASSVGASAPVSGRGPARA